MAKKMQEIVIKAQSNVDYTFLQNFDLSTQMSKEMEGLTATFDHIKMPSGGITMFSIPSEDPTKPELITDFSAIILYHHPMRAYYKDKYTGGNNPPDCGSFDGVTGQGEPSGICHECPFNEFGTGENGAKACKERRRLYLLRQGEMFPIVLSLPPGSLKDFSRYLIRCLSKGFGSNAVVTHFSLTTTTNKGGIVYAKANFTLERPLSEAELPLVEDMSEQIKKFCRNCEISASMEKKPLLSAV